MIMPNLGWSTDNVWTFTLPTADPSHCQVIITEVIDITEDGAPSTAVYFYNNAACIQPCTSISIDPAKVEYELKFKVKATFGHSDD